MGEQVLLHLSESNKSTEEKLTYFDRSVFERLRLSSIEPASKAELFGLLVRYNTLYMIKKAGSGHIGSSFSSIDIMTWLYLNVLRGRDRYFSSKGHDSPALYAIQAGLGIIPFEKIHTLRRFGGLPGHPDVKTPGAFTNTGSLGMGVSKAKGFLYGDQILGNQNTRVYVLTGDGELQEGQFWESLSIKQEKISGNINVIVDHNKIQSDTFVADVSDLGDLELKFQAFGLPVKRIDGHDYTQLKNAFIEDNTDAPIRVIIADTIKGKGISFMEHTSMSDKEIYYKYHSGAPSYKEYKSASDELYDKICTKTHELSIDRAKTSSFISIKESHDTMIEHMIPAYSNALLKVANFNCNVVALDADLVLDTGLIPFKESYPHRFIECGIAEQDMVSQAGTLALAGCIPVVHSFSCFLTSRASEQIYNNCTQDSKVVYVGSLAGVLPAGPGHSHQAVRDYTAMMGMPNMTLIEPFNAKQIERCVSWAVNQNTFSTYIRLTSVPYSTCEEIKSIDDFNVGQGVCITDENDMVIIAFGPIIAFNALKAVQALENQGITPKVIITPWINQIDMEWLEYEIRNASLVVLIENHYQVCGVGAHYIASIVSKGKNINKRFYTIGIKELPVCGQNDEVLEYHNLSESRIKDKIAILHDLYC